VDKLTDRQRLLVYAALNYAQCNVDDMNDAFLDFAQEDEWGRVSVGGVMTSPFMAHEFMPIFPLFQSEAK
jgi:hypothetical protein